MRGTVHRRWLQRLANAIRRLAALLGRFSSSAPPDPAIQQLEAQFPDAPKHWLEYVAARAPHAAPPATETTRPQSMPDHGENARAAPREPVQARSRNATRRPTLLRLFDPPNRPSAEISQDRKPDEQRRSRLRLLSFSGPERQRSKLARPGFARGAQANEVKQQAAEPRHAGIELRKPQPGLHLAPHRSGTAAPPQLSVAAQRGKAPRTLGSIARSVRAALNRTRRRPAYDETRRAVVAQMAPPRAQTSSPATTRPSQLRDNRVTIPASKGRATVADRDAPGGHQLIIHASRETRRDSMRTLVPETGAGAPDLRWPALPVLDGSLPDAPIRPPDFSHLCREQEQGLWNA
jgi:hypothetical protein